MKYEIDLDLKEYMVQTFTDGYYRDSQGNLIPFKIEVTNIQEIRGEEAEEKITVTFLDTPPNGNTDLINETIIDSLFEPVEEVLLDRRDYLTITHSSGVVTDENGEFYPFTVEVLNEEGEQEVINVVWDDIQPEGDINEIQDRIIDVLFNN